MAESFFATLECELLDRTKLSDARGGAGGSVRVHRGVVQHASPSFGARLSVAPRVRAAPRGGPCGRLCGGARPVDALRAPTSPLDPALRAGSTPPTENQCCLMYTALRESKALICPRDRGQPHGNTRDATRLAGRSLACCDRLLVQSVHRAPSTYSPPTVARDSESSAIAAAPVRQETLSTSVGVVTR